MSADLFRRTRRIPALLGLTALLTTTALTGTIAQRHPHHRHPAPTQASGMSAVPMPMPPQPMPLPWLSDGPPPEVSSKADSTLTLALKLVDYTSSAGKTVLSPEQSHKVLNLVNEIYSSCNMQFRLEQYVPANPVRYALAYHPSSMKELDPIRKAFEDPTRLLVVDTGSWDHSRGLGAEGANAWTMLPGEPTEGAIMEGPVAANANLLAHELGHYLNLRHVGDQNNLMNPVVYGYSRKLSPAQCSDARQAARGPRSQALRPS